VVSVPLDVTGDGPTRSLGLSTLAGFDDTRSTEPGRKRPESVEGGGEELMQKVSGRELQLYGLQLTRL
jgi:hypothetical protein